MTEKGQSGQHGTSPISEARGDETPEMARMGLERLVFFSDGIFAIAITLLALEIRVPSGEGQLTDRQLFDGLVAIGPKYLAFVLSFLVIGTFWIGHHRRFRYIESADSRLMFLNLLLLMGIAFMPFPTVLISEYGNQTATIFYALTVCVIGLLAALVWAYATAGRRLVSPTLSVRTVQREMLRGLIIPAIFLLSIGLALFNSDLAKLSWILLLPAWLAIH